MYRPFVVRLFKQEWLVGLFLILLFGASRFLLVLQANRWGNYKYVSLLFIVMWLIPFIILTKKGRRAIKLRGIPLASLPKVFFGFLGGVALAVIIFILGLVLYDLNSGNWFVYISNTYQSTGFHEEVPFFTVFVISALVSMIFSPIGEEFLYRGVIQYSFVQKFKALKASIIDASAFALVHLAHFGINYIDHEWVFLPLPALLWVLLMFSVALFFDYVKNKSGSLWGAVFAHMGFNLGMTYLIFYHILK